MKSNIFLILITIFVFGFARKPQSENLFSTYYLSPEGDDATGDGSIGNPWFSLNKAWDVLAAGDRVYMRGGTYEYDEQQDCTGVSGSSGNEIEIWNYPDETPNLTTSGSYPTCGQDLIIFAGDYFHWKGLEISYATGNTCADWAAFRSEGCNNCLFENIYYHHNQLGFTIRNCNNNTFLNCDFAFNQDAAEDNADGLNITYIDAADSAFVNYVTNCRAWNNSDDGFDYWANAGTVITTGSWAWRNGYEQDGTTPSAGDGAGFKMGQLASAATTSLRRQYINCVASANKNWGFIENDLPARIEMINCSVYNSSVTTGDLANEGNYLVGYWSFDNPVINTNCITYVGGYTLPSSEQVSTTNSWQGGITVSDADFESVDWTELADARQSDFSLPNIEFLHLATGSDLIDAGTNVGYGDDIGAFQYVAPGSTNPFRFFFNPRP